MAVYTHHEAITGLRRNFPQLFTRKVVLPIIVFIIILLLYLHSLISDEPPLAIEDAIPQQESIPKIVHIVHLRFNENTALHFSFQFFLCVYSAYHFIQPSILYIHTDYGPEDIQKALLEGSPWTKKVLTAFPGVVQLNPVIAPVMAANGLPLIRIEHKSDFVRMEQVGLHGGIYIDSDVLTLRSPEPLLKAGFKAIVGRQGDNLVNNGCFMATTDSALVHLMNKEMPTVFSGEWQHHSSGLITSISERLVYVPGEVLIMESKAFAPTGWWDQSAFALFSEHEGEEAVVDLFTQVNVDTVDPIERWENKTRGRDWEIDFSPTYFLHAFKALWGPVPNFEGISLPYVVRRTSNYALAAWPIVAQGIRDGIIDPSETSL